MPVIDRDAEKMEALLGAKFLRAFMECSDSIQEIVTDMLRVINDPDSDVDDRDMALFTLADALFPNPHDGKLGMDLAESEQMGASHSDEMRQAIEGMDAEEATFAERLHDIMARRGVTQEILADKVGVGQPAISNMLNRECRPQLRTVVRLAEALDVRPDELWPTPNDRPSR